MCLLFYMFVHTDIKKYNKVCKYKDVEIKIGKCSTLKLLPCSYTERLCYDQERTNKNMNGMPGRVSLYGIF